MSAVASAYLAAIVERYVTESSPNLDSWHFDQELFTPCHQELDELRYIQRIFGSVHGFAWRLRTSAMDEALDRGWIK